MLRNRGNRSISVPGSDSARNMAQNCPERFPAGPSAVRSSLHPRPTPVGARIRFKQPGAE
eukprot:7760403-Alexandrium_andersonii.AAC.1